MAQFAGARFVTILVIVILAGGCASTGYFADRGRDLGDVATLTLGDGIGARVVVGPLYVNSLVHVQEDRIGWQNGGPTPMSGEDVNRDYGAWFGFGQEWRYPSKRQTERRKGYTTAIAAKIPFLMRFEDGGADSRLCQIEVAAAAGLGVRAGLNPVELLDFLLGWTLLDIVGDDLRSAREREPADDDRGSAPQ